ncbi:MAG: hypothetical protein JOS17DRAFT_755122 [Linnemannia elongata]|nr:MAG: hypothetical protein JOS17DRAFT_755122 [Linnemannia elongata]
MFEEQLLIFELLLIVTSCTSECKHCWVVNVAWVKLLCSCGDPDGVSSNCTCGEAYLVFIMVPSTSLYKDEQINHKEKVKESLWTIFSNGQERGHVYTYRSK